jgi:cell pole-organizing protein PopZ
MNKPAPKEPSMDEILSSIRQIIADDDAATAPRKPAPPMAPPPVRPAAAAPAPAMVQRAVEPEPLALTPAQMLRPEPQHEPAFEEEAASVLNFSDMLGADDQAPEMDDGAMDAPPLVDPEDITFEADDGPEPEVATFPVPVEAPPPPAPPIQMAPPPVPRAAPPRPAPAVSRVAPMPDPTLTSDMAEELLAPATSGAVKHTFAKLNGLTMQGAGLTLDDLMRDMLRPMLKEWLDENLPSLVERMVEKEIARISRGGE